MSEVPSCQISLGVYFKYAVLPCCLSVAVLLRPFVYVGARTDSKEKKEPEGEVSATDRRVERER